MHAPPRQSCPHAPQFFPSLLVSTHAVPHLSGVLPVQLIAQLAPLHDAAPIPAVGPGHALPHIPPAPHPFCGPGVSHVPAQSNVPDGHAQLLPEHVLPPVHPLPQLPQLAGSLV
jgi:hypothetical protein